MSLIKQPYEIKADKLTLKVLLYGVPGIGKSTLALSMPKPVLIDADSGVARVAPQHRVPTLSLTSYQELLDLLSSGELAPFETMVIDTAGKLLDYINAAIVAENPKWGTSSGGLSMQGWGVRARRFEYLNRQISILGKHVVYVAHEKEERDGEIRISRPDFGGGKSAGDLIKDLDLVGYMEAVGKNRTVSFSPCERYYAKNAARIDDVLQIPTLNQGVPNNFLAGIVAKCAEAMNAESEDVGKYHVLMGDLTGQIDAAKDVKGLNEVFQVISGVTHIFDSKQKSWSLLCERAETLKILYDRASKTFKVDKPKKAETPKAEVPAEKTPEEAAAEELKSKQEALTLTLPLEEGAA